MKFLKPRHLLTVCILCITLYSCQKDNVDNYPETGFENALKVFMTDNNLSNESSITLSDNVTYKVSDIDNLQTLQLLSEAIYNAVNTDVYLKDDNSVDIILSDQLDDSGEFGKFQNCIFGGPCVNVDGYRYGKYSNGKNVSAGTSASFTNRLTRVRISTGGQEAKINVKFGGRTIYNGCFRARTTRNYYRKEGRYTVSAKNDGRC